MRKVPFKVAKALKDAGYPQDNCLEVYFEDGSYLYTGGILLTNRVYYKIDSYLEVWLWLWRYKKFYVKPIPAGKAFKVQILDHKYGEWRSWGTVFPTGTFTDQEEAIIEAIDYLVKNNIIR